MPLHLNNPQHFADLLISSESSFQSYFHSVGAIAELRKRFESVIAPVMKNTEEQTSSPAARPTPPVGSTLRQREPMRPPKQGSIRATVHAVLRRNGQPMRRCDVIAEVAAARGIQTNELLDAKVGDALGNRHDPLIRKISTGIYQMVLEGKELS